MVGFEEPRARQRGEVCDAVAKGLHPIIDVEVEVANAERIKHRSDAGGRALPVMGEKGGAGRPSRTGPRLHLTLEIVGVQVDDAGHQDVSVEDPPRPERLVRPSEISAINPSRMTSVPRTTQSPRTSSALARMVSVMQLPRMGVNWKQAVGDRVAGRRVMHDA